MIRYKTYNNTLETLKCLGTQHKQIETVTTGDLFDVDLDANNLYPLMHVIIQDADVSMSEQKFNFRVLIMDLVEPDLSNEDEVMSDTYQTMVDLIALLKHGEILYSYAAAAGEEQRYFEDNDFTISPFTERFTSNVSGWVCDISIIVESVLDSCDIPIDNSVACGK
jgi:hypothetical protein